MIAAASPNPRPQPRLFTPNPRPRPRLFTQNPRPRPRLFAHNPRFRPPLPSTHPRPRPRLFAPNPRPRPRLFAQNPRFRPLLPFRNPRSAPSLLHLLPRRNLVDLPLFFLHLHSHLFHLQPCSHSCFLFYSIVLQFFSIICFSKKFAWLKFLTVFHTLLSSCYRFIISHAHNLSLKSSET